MCGRKLDNISECTLSSWKVIVVGVSGNVDCNVAIRNICGQTQISINIARYKEQQEDFEYSLIKF